jgi:hypothetical protein
MERDSPLGRPPRDARPAPLKATSGSLSDWGCMMKGTTRKRRVPLQVGDAAWEPCRWVLSAISREPLSKRPTRRSSRTPEA